MDLGFEFAGGGGDTGGEHGGAAGQQSRWEDRSASESVACPLVVVVGCGVGAGGQCFADAGCAVAGADVAVAADGVGEFDEPAVLPGGQERR